MFIYRGFCNVYDVYGMFSYASGRFHCNCARNIPNISEMHRTSDLWAARHSVGSSFPVVRSHTTSRNARKRALDGERRLYIWAWGYKEISIIYVYIYIMYIMGNNSTGDKELVSYLMMNQSIGKQRHIDAGTT